MQIFAHRGASGYAPENTLAAMDKALELGVSALEIDVHACDGELLVFHDRRMEKMSSKTGLIHTLPLEQVKQAKIQGESIATLWQLMTYVHAQSCGQATVNIELKGNTCLHAFVSLYPKLIHDLGYKQEQLLISSFNHPMLAKFAKQHPSALIAPLLSGIPLNGAEIVSQLNAYSLNISLDFITHELIHDAHQRGAKVFVYTVDNVDDIRALQCAGVDGIFSNFPDKAKAALLPMDELTADELEEARKRYQPWFPVSC